VSWHPAIPKTTPGFAVNTPSWTVDLYAGRSRTITAIDEPGSLHAVHAYRNRHGMNGWTALAAEPDER
jgi:hypothetical protein